MLQVRLTNSRLIHLYFYALAHQVMSRRKIVGYNSDFVISVNGTRLVSTSGELLVLPAGYQIVEMEIKKITTPKHNASQPTGNLIIYLLKTDSPLVTNITEVINIAELNYNKMKNIRVSVGVYKYDNVIMIRSEQEDVNDFGVCVSAKIKKIE